MKNYFFAFLFLLLNSVTHSQNIQFSKYGTKQGLSSESSYKIIQDKEGFIWIATYDGLNRYDGIEFKNYKADIKDSNSIAGNMIIDLMIDSEDNLWIATNQGLCMYNKFLDHFEKRIKVADVHKLSVRSCMQDKNGNFWIASSKLIYVVSSDNKLVRILNEDLDDSWIGNTSILCLLEDSEGLIWIATQERGVFSYNPETHEKKSYSDIITSKEIFSVVEDTHGNIWFGTNEDPFVYVIKDDRFYNIRMPDSPFNLPSFPISSVADDGNGTLWISNWGSGLTQYDINTNSYFTYSHNKNDKTSLGGGSFEYAYIDNEGNVWTVGQASGLNVYYKNGRAFNLIRNLNESDAGIFTSPTTAIDHDNEGNIWLGTDGGGLSKWDPYSNLFENYKTDPENPRSYGGTSVLTLFVDSRDNIWAGGYNSKFNLFNRETMDFTVFDVDNELPYIISGKDIRDITEDNYGRIWVATNGGGINIYEPETFNREVINVENNGIVSDYCLALMIDDKERVFIATYSGLSIYDMNSRSVENYVEGKTSPDSLSSGWVYCTYQDKKGRYWIGTQLGLSLFNDTSNTFKTYFEEDGLVNNTIMSIEEDIQGRLWISTGDGISVFDPEKESFQNYNSDDGLPDSQFRMGASTQTDEGTIYFGSNNGVLFFDPEKIVSNKTVPIIRFTDLFINSKRIVPGKMKILKQHIEYTDKIILGHKQNFVSIRFVALSYFQSAKNTYKYKLEGVDPDWVDCGTNNSASYTNLRHGKYTFQVIAYNNDGVPSEIRAIDIRIKPAWYQTKIFYIFIILLVIYGIYLFIKQREATAKRDKEILEKRISEGEKLIREKMEQLENQKKELEERDVQEKETRFHNEGIAIFSDIINKNRDNINELSTKLVSELVRYVNAGIGVIYIIDDSTPDSKVLKISGKYCLDCSSKEKNEFIAGEGYVGTCYSEKKTLEIDNLPSNYIKLNSGLGETSLHYNLLVPIINADQCLGVFEIASVKKISLYKKEFIEKISDNFSAILAITKANEHTNELLKVQKLQAEELASQEEELRQNLEEMNATQEELSRQMEESKKVKADLDKEKILVDSLLTTAREKIYFKDLKSRFLKASNSLAEMFNASSDKELIGKSDFDFFTEEHARPAYDDEMKIIKTGKPIIDKIEKETHVDGRVTYVSTTKMPLKDENGKIIGTFGISKDITKVIELEQAAKTATERLEMENIMFTTLMDNITARITFKDIEAKYLRVNKTKMKSLKINDNSAVAGKTDADIFGESHGKEFLEKEIVNIKKGQTSLNNEELIRYKDGHVSWGSTSRIPLKNKKNEIVGGLVITWDVTDRKDMEFNLEQNMVILKKISEDLPAILFDIDENNLLNDVSGKGLEYLGLKKDTNAAGKISELFPEINTAIQKRKNDEIINLKGETQTEKSKIKYKILLVKNKTIKEGYSGYILLQEE